MMFVISGNNEKYFAYATVQFVHEMNV